MSIQDRLRDRVRTELEGAFTDPDTRHVAEAVLRSTLLAVGELSPQVVLERKVLAEALRQSRETFGGDWTDVHAMHVYDVLLSEIRSGRG